MNMKYLFIILLFSKAFASGRDWRYERPKDYKTQYYKSSSLVYDEKRERLDIGISTRQRDLKILQARIFEAAEWTELEKDYLLFRAKNVTFRELKEIYSQIEPYKLKRLKESVNPKPSVQDP